MENRMNEMNQKFNKETGAGRSLLLWLIGIPLPIILILWLITGHC